MKYRVVINKTEYGYDAHCPALPGCHCQGDTLDEALENIGNAITACLRMIEEETQDSPVYQASGDKRSVFIVRGDRDQARIYAFRPRKNCRQVRAQICIKHV